MPDKAPLIFLKCTARKKSFENGGSLLNISVKATDMTAFLAKHTNKRGYLNLTVKERREEGQYGDTHMVVLDPWEPPTKPQDVPF